MNRIGRNAISMMTGAFAPTSWLMPPRTAATLYPGAVEATPITMLDSRPIAPSLRPLPATPGAGWSERGVGAVVVICAVLEPVRGTGDEVVLRLSQVRRILTRV